MTRALIALLLIGCAESHAPPADAGHTAPDLGGCVGLAATPTEAGPVAHVYAYPDGHPCGDGGVSAGEVAAMHEVLTQRMRGTYQRTAWQYSAGLRNPRRESTHDMGRAPLTRGYPALHREHWPRVLAAADEAVAGRLTHGCDARPLQHWGGPQVDRSSIARMLRDGMRAATCPGYANTFLVRGEP